MQLNKLVPLGLQNEPPQLKQDVVIQLTIYLRFARYLLSSGFIFVGVVLLFFDNLFIEFPPMGRYVMTTGTVVNKIQHGTFQEPGFFIILEYEIMNQNGEPDDLQSGQSVDFEAFQALSRGDTVSLSYDKDDPFEWQLMLEDNNKAREKVVGFSLLIMGMLVLLLPQIVSAAVRREDFGY